MLRLLHHCLIAVCLMMSLMRLMRCAEYEYDTTPLPDYDYNATFEYGFFSNGSREDLDRFLLETEFQEVTTVSTTASKAFRIEYPSVLLILILNAHQLLRVL